MKKLIILTSIFALMLFVVGFKISKSKIHKMPATPISIYHVTLNGTDEKKAKAMICHFNMIKSNDKRPLPTMVFFNIDTVRNFVKLLDNELRTEQAEKKKNGDTSRIGLTDGIRIYFVCDQSAKGQKLDTKVLLVSTKDNGPSSDPTCLSGRLHKDYYDHTVDPSTLKDGEVSHNGAKIPGKTLYNCATCVFKRTECTIPGQNNITGLRAIAMVAAFRLRGHPINSASVWFDLNKFETFATMNPDTTTGIRIYFATHLFADKKVPSRDAMVMTPTKKNKRNSQYNDDYLDCKAEDSYWNNYLKLYHKYLYDPSNAVDNAELCPDNCN